MKTHTPNRLLSCCSAVVALIAAAASVTPAQTRADYVSQVRVQLNVIKATVEDDGYEKTHEYKIDSLDQSRTDSFNLTLNKGSDYLLVSACDKDCSDLDISVYDENGNQIASDTEVDDVPMVSVTPRWTGAFRIQVTMHKCNTSPCFYGIGIFGK